MVVQDFFALSRQELQERCAQLGLPQVHADTLFRRAYKELIPNPWLGQGLPIKLQEYGQRHFKASSLTIQEEFRSRYDGSVKFLVRLEDGALVESVLMPEKKRITLCLSSQVGCAMACRFCHTGRMGLKRQLSAAEIVGQVVLAQQWIAQHPDWKVEQGYPSFSSLSNLVFMGMGEPLDNIEAVCQALHILPDPLGLNLALRKISVSTAGHFDGLKILLQKFPRVSLALSLHASNDRERSQLMPINRRWPILEILAYLREHYSSLAHEAHLLIQYTVIKGVNDSLAHADELVELLHGLPIKLNLIPLNEIEVSRFQGPEPCSLEAFRDRINGKGMRVMIRYSKGQDIAAACGQLVVKAEREQQANLDHSAI